jgi:hypothetical protein
VPRGWSRVSSEIEKNRLYYFSVNYDKCDPFAIYGSFDSFIQHFPSWLMRKIDSAAENQNSEVVAERVRERETGGCPSPLIGASSLLVLKPGLSDEFLT